MRIAVVIPWRSSNDPDRDSAQRYVEDYYNSLPLHQVIVTSDGTEAGPFNRHRAYNLGYAQTDADVILWNEADTLIPLDQIEYAAHLALETPGLVIPYSERHELDATQTATVYDHDVDPFTLTGEYAVYRDGTSIGQAGVTSHATIDAIGGQWDERFAGWGYDDNAMMHVFALLAGSPRWVQGKGVHLWHVPVHQANPDNEQTQRNAARHAWLTSLTPDELRTHLAHA